MDIILRTSFWDVLMTFAGRFSKTLRIKCESLVFHATHLVSTIEHNTALMFFIMSKIDVLETSQGCHYACVTLEPN